MSSNFGSTYFPSLPSFTPPPIPQMAPYVPPPIRIESYIPPSPRPSLSYELPPILPLSIPNSGWSGGRSIDLAFPLSMNTPPSPLSPSASTLSVPSARSGIDFPNFNNQFTDQLKLPRFNHTDFFPASNPAPMLKWITDQSQTPYVYKINFDGGFAKPPTPRQPLYTDHDRISFLRAAPAAQLEQINQLFLASISSQFAPQLPGSTLQELAPFTHKYPPMVSYALPNPVIVTIPPPPRKSSVEITVVGEENGPQQPYTLGNHVANVASKAWTHLKIGFAHIGIENLDLPANERTEILETYAQKLRSQLPAEVHPKIKFSSPENRGNFSLLPPLRRIVSSSGIRDLVDYNNQAHQYHDWGAHSKIDYLQCYDKMRFDPTSMLKATSISELLSKLETFSSNMVVHGENIHPLSRNPNENFDRKASELMNLFEKIPSLRSSGIIASYLGNGINVKGNEFEQYVAIRSQSYNKGILTIGCYNKSYGFNWDYFQRVSDEFEGKENFSVEQMRNQLAFASKACDLLGPNYYVTFELHSEGALQYFNAFQKLCDAQKELVRKHVLVVTLGGIRPIPKEFGLEVRNIYSEDDISFKTYGKAFLNNPDYMIKVVGSIIPENERTISHPVAEHAYLGKTYTKHSLENLNELDDEYHYIRFKE